MNHTLILRAQPDADPDTALRIWCDGELSPMMAADVLRACGPHRLDAVDTTLASRHDAVSDQGAAARLAAVTVVEDPADARLTAVRRELAADPSMPAIVRAVAAWTSAVPALPDDPMMRRYATWKQTRADAISSPLVDLLSGAWLHDTLTD
jgi:hypothetical protein